MPREDEPAAPSQATRRDGAKKRGRPAAGAPARARGGEGGTVRALTRALDLLEDIAATPGGATLGDLALRAELAPSTAHRLLKTLEARRFVAQDPERGLWFAGVQAFIVGAGFLRNRDFVTAARPAMQGAMERSGESVNLAVLDQGQAIYLSQVESRQMMRALAPPGGRAPLHASGVGKALLAGLAPEAAERLIGALAFTRHTGRTIDAPAALAADIAAARARGYAVDDEEHAVGLRCVAAPIFNEFAEPLAAVSISGPRARIGDDRFEALGQLIRATAAEITARLGGRAPEAYGAR